MSDSFFNSTITADFFREVAAESNIIDPDDPRESYLKYFYLEPHERLGFVRGGIADFSKLFSVHKTSYERLLQKKILQLRPEIAMRMAYKLAMYFFREEQAPPERGR